MDRSQGEAWNIRTGFACKIAARPSQRHLEREKMKLLWEIEIPPIDLNEVADKIGDRERMELIKALVCASGERFDQRQLLAWLAEFVKNNEVEADL
jgi:hypothetical protein